jgi:methionyl-tRNA formyltransferase
MKKLSIKLLGSPDQAAYAEAEKLIISLGHRIVEFNADIQVAPCLTKILLQEDFKNAHLGTLIFHPSPLPYGRGASSIRWAYKRAEPVTAATWFWAQADGIDNGDICEQEIIKIDLTSRPRDFYMVHILPSMLRTLKRALNDVSIGIIRRIPQVEEYSTYDPKACY